MDKLKLGYRKLNLQIRLVFYLRKSKNIHRRKEQRNVLKYLLLNPKELFNYEVNSEYKYVRVITANARHDLKYKLALNMLKEGD